MKKKILLITIVLILSLFTLIGCSSGNYYYNVNKLTHYQNVNIKYINDNDLVIFNDNIYINLGYTLGSEKKWLNVSKKYNIFIDNGKCYFEEIEQLK